jgi:1-acyl-sn-glycerol-3-phosphate acyltransferase
LALGGEEADVGAHELRQALDALRDEIRARLPRASGAGEGRGAGPDWMELFDELRRRVNSFGMSERSGEVDEFGMDELVLRQVEPVLDFLMDRWWRVDIQGAENVPTAQGCLLAANGSGLLPYDGLMISHALGRGQPFDARPRFLVADWLITLPFVQPYLARLGGVRACRENAQRLLAKGRRVVAFPEGVKGAAKVFRERYRLKRFGRGGVVRLAIESGMPLLPVAVVGAEEAHPILFKIETLARVVGLPFVPVTPTFPALGPLGLVPLPSKWSICFGEAIALDHLGSEAADDELLVSRLTEELRAQIQGMVEQSLHGRPSVWG